MAKCGIPREIGGAVQGIDHPALLTILARDHAALLQEEAEGRPRSIELTAQDLLGAPVGGADEITRPLDRHLKILDLAEVADQMPRRLVHGLDHHGDVGERRAMAGTFVQSLARST